MTREGSDVRGATIAKAAPQVIVGCGYLMGVIISPCRKRPYCKRFGNGSNPLVGAEDANFRKVAGSYISACLCNIYKRNQDATKHD